MTKVLIRLCGCQSWSAPLLFTYIKIRFSCNEAHVLIDFLLTVKVATLIFISGHSTAISSAKEGKSGFIYNIGKE